MKKRKKYNEKYPKKKSKYWRIVIPNLIEYKDSSTEELQNLKSSIYQKLKAKEEPKGLQYYHIACESHQNKVPHLDILIIYARSIQHRFAHFDYLLKHGNITTYRQLNDAILNYGKKEDNDPISNLPENNNQIIKIQELKKDPYFYLEQKMDEDPFNFNVEEYVKINKLASQIKGWSSIKTKLKDMQTAEANIRLRNKPGFQFITRSHIRESLTRSELKIFDSWSGYQTIVDYLNQIPTYGYVRPLKTKNLLITGKPNIGKTCLFQSGLAATYNSIDKYISVYPMGMRTWWPNYRSETYKLILWNEAKLTSYSYDTILKLLEGSRVDLPYKGGSTKKYDNPLVILTSNLTLEQMILQKFPGNKQYQQMARSNLFVRIENVIVPEDYNLFLLQKLFN